MHPLLSDLLFEHRTLSGTGESQAMLRAMPVMLAALCILAIAYRFYSRFLATQVARLDPDVRTPAHELNDGNNYHPTNRWVLFGHHFAAISGAGPLIGPVLAMQYGYAPGLLWLLIGVCLAGAVQDMLVMAASVRRGGKSLAEIAKAELGPQASAIASLAILFIVVIALAGLAIIVVKALGGEEVKLLEGMTIRPPGSQIAATTQDSSGLNLQFPPGCRVKYHANDPESIRGESFQIRIPLSISWLPKKKGEEFIYVLPKGATQVIAGSSWGTFTIACTIPIALFVGWWMYRVRKGRVVEASVIGGIMTLGAVMLGAYIPGSMFEGFFSLSKEQTIIVLAVYGFIAATLPVWLLLTPRDYLSSFMKIGTLILLIAGVIIANPTLMHPPINETFRDGGPTFKAGGLFPFVFICVMCGAISGFHSLVSSGTTPKMVDRETDVRMIGYGAMLMEGLVGIVALIAAASMPPELYYTINVSVDDVPKYQKQLDSMYETLKSEPAANDKMHVVGVRNLHDMNLSEIEESVGGESLRGRTGGAVTLAVSMATILTNAFNWADGQVHALMKYWYHFAIMFEALFILTTIDAGTRIARYLFQEAMGKIHPDLGRQDWGPGVVISTLVVTGGWAGLVWSGQIATIWPMFGIANQLLSVMALAIVTTWLFNSGRGKHAFVTIPPMLFVMSTTLTACAKMTQTLSTLNLGLMLFVMASVMTVVIMCMARWFRPKRA
jgi:carbon starvation protein